MRKLSLCIITCALLPLAISGQSFQKAYSDGQQNYNFGTGLFQRSDGKYLMIGEYREMGNDFYSWIACLEENGEPAWVKKVDNLDAIGTMALMPDDGLAALFPPEINSGTTSIIARFAADGSVIWSRHLKGLTAGILATPTSIYASGVTNEPSSHPWPYVARLDHGGQPIWEKQFDRDSLGITFLKSLPNNHILIVLANENHPSFRSHLVEITESGEIVRGLSCNTDRIQDVLALADGRLALIVQGNTNSAGAYPDNFCVSMLDANWQFQWTKVFTVGENANLELVQLAGQDSILLCIGGRYDRLFTSLHLDGQGNLGAQKTIRVKGSTDVIATTDGGLAIRTRTVPDALHGEHLTLAKTDAQLRLPDCPVDLPVCGIEVHDTTLITQTSAWSFLPASQISDAQITISPLTWQSEEYCQPIPTLDAGFTVSDTSPCANSLVNFFPNEPTTSAWTFPGAIPGLSDEFSPQNILFSGTGQQTIRHIAFSGCLLDTAYFTINVLPPPTVEIAGDSVYCEGNSVQLTAQGTQIDYLLWNDGLTDSTRTAFAGLYSVTAYSVNGCATTDSLRMEVIPVPDLTLIGKTVLCTGDTLHLTAFSNTPNLKYLWDDASTANQRIIHDAGTYSVEVRNTAGCSADAEMSISKVQRPSLQINISADLSCKGVLTAISDQLSAVYSWNDGRSGPQLEVHGTGWHTVTVSNGDCQTADSVYLDLQPCPDCALYIPNIFHPESAVGNSHFQVYSDCAAGDFSLQIFDRWGTLMFATNQPTQSWDGTFAGKKAPAGVYAFLLRMELDNGNQPVRLVKKGDLTLIR